MEYTKFIIVAVMLTVLSSSVGGAQGTVAFKIVVNADNPSDTMSAEELSRVFLKKVKTWSNGEPMDPIDLESKSEVRKSFSKEIHGRSISAVKSYWQKMIFSGRAVPPAEKATDEQVLAYVSTTTWAIGYVSASAQLGDGVKVLQVTK